MEISPERWAELISEVRTNTVRIETVLSNQEVFKTRVDSLDAKMRVVEDKGLVQNTSLKFGVAIITAILTIAVALGSLIAKPIAAFVQELTK